MNHPTLWRGNELSRVASAGWFNNAAKFTACRMTPTAMGVDFDDFEIRFSGTKSLHVVAAAAQALDRDFVVQPRHDHLARARLVPVVHGEQIAIEIRHRAC